MTPTPIIAATTCAVRQPASPAIRPPTAGPSVCPVISAIEKPAIATPRRSGGALVANTVMPVVLVSAEAAPRKNTAMSAWANDPAPASRLADSATPMPVPARARPGGSRSASRPAGRSIASRPSANAVVIIARSAAVSLRSRPISGSSGARMNDAMATDSTTPPASRVGPVRCGRCAVTNVCTISDAAARANVNPGWVGRLGSRPRGGFRR